MLHVKKLILTHSHNYSLQIKVATMQSQFVFNLQNKYKLQAIQLTEF